MTTFNTGNAVPSGDAKDRFDNSQTFDEFINGPVTYYVNRTHGNILSLAGMKALFDTSQINRDAQFAGAQTARDSAFTAEQADRDAKFKAQLLASGYEVPVDYAPGISITRGTQQVRYLGELYRPKDSSLPFVTTTFPADSAKWISNGDNALRQELASTTGTDKIGRGDQTLEQFLGVLTKQQGDYVAASMEDDIGDVRALTTAIANGSVTIAVTGDSILEGNSQILYEDSVIGVIRRSLIQQNPNVVINIINYSLAGLAMGSLADINFKGGTLPVTPGVTFYRAPGGQADNAWPTGSVVGKAWIDHARDAAPDLLIIGLGANDVNGDSYVFSESLRTVIAYSKLWTKPPSLAIVPTALPSKIHPVGIPIQKPLQRVADAARGMAREQNCTLLDVNRRFLLMREGIDVCNKKYNGEGGWGAYPSGWDIGSSSYSFTTPGVVLSGSGKITRLVTSEDIHLAATFTCANYATAVPAIFYRAESAALCYTLSIAGGATLRLDYNGTNVLSAPLGFTVPNGTAVRLEVRCEGAKHMLYVNSIFIATVWNYYGVASGQHGIVITGSTGTSSAAYDVQARFGNSYKVGVPQMNDVDIYGLDDWLTNPDSDGGNAINHHTKKGGILVWAVAFAPLMHIFKRTQDNTKAKTVRLKVQDTTTAFDSVPAQFVAIRIDGTTGQVGGVCAASATAAIATAEACMKVLGGRNVPVDVVLTVTGTVLATSITLPAGYWSVRATLMMTRNASGYNNNLSIEAISTF